MWFSYRDKSTHRYWIHFSKEEVGSKLRQRCERQKEGNTDKSLEIRSLFHGSKEHENTSLFNGPWLSWLGFRKYILKAWLNICTLYNFPCDS